jgi:hypothetical protein
MFVVKEGNLCLYRIYLPHLLNTNHVNADLCRDLLIVKTCGRRMASPPQASGGSAIASQTPSGASDPHCQIKHKWAFMVDTGWL